MKSENKFKSLGLDLDLVENLSNIGFEEPTPIQERAIPELLKGERDILGLAQTGTGKTASFALPMIQNLDPHSKFVQALILAPTRELARQIGDEIHRLKGERKVDSVVVYGGSPIDAQIRRLRARPSVVVGTPGRVIDLLERGILKLEHLRYVVLDEADDMLNMGFIEDVETILGFASADRSMLLFSATMPPRLKDVVQRYMNDPLEINLRPKDVTNVLTRQVYYSVFPKGKFEALRRLIDANPDFYGIVFCRTKVDVDELNQKLVKRGYPAEALHGDIRQAHREKLVNRFRDRHVRVLVATDVASRGVDFQGVTHVVNYTLPLQPETYVHRIGRTGRAGKTGTAVSFVTPTEQRFLSNIKRVVKGKILEEDPPAVADIMVAQKDHILDKVKVALEGLDQPQEAGTLGEHCMGLAKTILEDLDPEVALAALLRTSCERSLNEAQYRPIDKPLPRFKEHRSGRRQNRRFSENRNRRFDRGGPGKRSQDRSRSRRQARVNAP